MPLLDLLLALALIAVAFLAARLYELIRDRRRAARARPVLRITYGRSSDPREMIVVVNHVRGGSVRISQVIAVSPEKIGEIAHPRPGSDPVLSETNTPVILYGTGRADPTFLESLYQKSTFNLYCVPGELIHGIVPGAELLIE